MSIPKIIHYCWLSDEPLPNDVSSYIKEWQKIMPDYQIKKWDKKAFDIHSSQWVEQAYEKRKWAFAADYIRVYALYTEGGFYLDSDVKVISRFDKYLDNGFVSSIEYSKTFDKSQLDASFHRIPTIDYVSGFGIQAAIIGAEKGHPFPLELLNYYNSHQFVSPTGELNMLPAPIIYAKLLEKKGFCYTDKEQTMEDNIRILASKVFAGYNTCTWQSDAIHMCNGSWCGGGSKMKKFKFLQRFQKNLFLRKLANTFKL